MKSLKDAISLDYLDYDVNWEKRNNYSCEKNAKIFCDIIGNL